MGVKDLWAIISPVAEKKSLWELENKTIAIDLSAWICDSQAIYAPSHVNIYLRNIIFRTSYLLLSGIKPIFVLEGEAPFLKSSTIRSRLEKGKETHKTNSLKVKRTRLNNMQKQCAELLSAMGLGCVQGPGEAEAYCAHLSLTGVVDGVITQDSDVFLYGAREVYRNFQMSPKFTCDYYSMDTIESKLGLTRTKLIGLSLLLGSDYCNKIHKLGKTDALRFIRSLHDDEIIQRFVDWRNESFFSGIVQNKYISKDASLEMKIREKCIADPMFPDLEIITEYFSEPESSEVSFQWNMPNLPKFISIAVKKLQWDEEYALQKLAPLLARWHLTNPDEPSTMKITSVIGIPTGKYSSCYRVQWNLYDLVSVEPKALVQSTYSHLVQVFEASKRKPKIKAASARSLVTSAKPENIRPTAVDVEEYNDLDMSGIIKNIVSRQISNPALHRLRNDDPL